MKVTGLDLSLADTGVAVIRSDRATDLGFEYRGRVELRRIQTKPTADALTARSLRLRGIVASLWPDVVDADLVAVEQPTYGAKSSGSGHDRSGLWWLTVGRITGAGIPVAEVHNGYLKMYATGSGNADKDRVLTAVVRRYPTLDVDNNNTADALVLAAMAARYLGFPIEDIAGHKGLPDTHLRAMTRVGWPTNREGARQHA